MPERAEGREPCPWRIVEDSGGSFLFGSVLGSIWHFGGGLRNGPVGHRVGFAIQRVSTRVPLMAGSFAIWGSLFSSFDCSFIAVRKKEDPFNAIMSGAAVGGLLASRAGPKALMTNAIMGGAILAAIEGLTLGINRAFSPSMNKKAMLDQSGEMELEPPIDYANPYKKPPPSLSQAQTSSGNSDGGLGAGLRFGLGGLGGLGGSSSPQEEEQYGSKLTTGVDGDGGLAKSPEFDFSTGRYKDQDAAEATEKAFDAEEDARRAVEDKKKGWW